jgi:Ca-activated chloride channel family protein
MGTAIGVALANSVARLRDSTAKSRVIILMTDGENNSGTIDPETALEIAKGYGIKVYTIGVGRDGMAQLPVWTEDAFGNRRKRYQPMMAKVNDELLSKIATETGGKYYRASESQALRNVFNEINNLEKSKIDVNKFTKYTELYQDYLKWGLILLSLSLLLTSVLVRRGP